MMVMTMVMMMMMMMMKMVMMMEMMKEMMTTMMMLMMMVMTMVMSGMTIKLKASFKLISKNKFKMTQSQSIYWIELFKTQLKDIRKSTKEKLMHEKEKLNKNE